MKRAIVYCRVSTTDQADHGTGLDGQEAESVAYCERAGLQVVRIIREDFTGTTLDRPGLTQAREMLEVGQAEAFVVHRPDRLDRSEWGINLLLLLQEFKGLGVELHYSQQGRQVDLHNPIEALMQSIAGWQAGEDRNSTVRKLADGRRNRARSGYVVPMGAQAPYGYGKVKDENGRWAFQVNEAEAEAVRLIFAWYTSGDRVTLRAIAQRLNKSGVMLRSGQPWYYEAVRDIISSEVYCGTWHYSKRGPHEAIPVPVPAIVDKATWQSAQRQKPKNRAESGRSPSGEYLLRRRIKCGCCNFAMGATYGRRAAGDIYSQRYSCQSKHTGKTDCTYGSIPANLADVTVWTWLEKILSDKEARRAAIEEIRAAGVTQAGPIEQELAAVSKSIAAAEASLARKLADLELLTTTRAKKLKNEEIEAVEAQLNGLEREQAQLQRKLDAARLTDEQLNSIERMMDQAAEGLAKARRSFAHRRQLVEILDVTAEAMKDEDGKRAVKASFAVFSQNVGETMCRLPHILTIEARLDLE